MWNGLHTTTGANTSPGPTLSGVVELAAKLAAERAKIDTDFVCTARTWEKMKAALPIWVDRSAVVDIIHGIPVYVYETQKECVGRCKELKKQGRRPVYLVTE